jgi:alpha-N-arabinofuranosidase
MKTAKIQIVKDFEISQTDNRLFSSFLEHLGRAIYGGIYEPGHPQADEEGLRKDVIKLVRELNVDYVRYPGGNFVSGYDWKDGIGPKADRPRRLDLAWKTVESNQFGIDEFYDWSKKAGTKIMCAVNMGTGTPKEAGQLLEYCNFPGGTYWSDLRAKNGHKDPMGIKLWCVGNEMDGSWQICHLDAAEYGKKARETAKIMKWIDPSVQLVVCGSSGPAQKTFPEWDRKVMEYTYDTADYLSIHKYYENDGNDLDFLASFVDMDRFIRVLEGTADYVKALKRGKKDFFFSFDEWNVWYQSQDQPHGWMEAPAILEDNYSLLDALVFAGLGMTLLNHADRVKIACLAQLVNVIAPICTKKGGPAIRQTIFYPFYFLSKYGRGIVLHPVVQIPKTETKYGETPLLYTSTVHGHDDSVTIFALNISKEDLMVDIDLASFGRLSMTEHICLNGNDLNAKNTFEHPDCVSPREITPVRGEFSKCSILLPKQSWNVLRFKIAS